MRIVDCHVGRTIWRRRWELRMSVQALGHAVGETCQQIVSYECGQAPVDAGRLVALAKALKVDAGYFFEGLSAGGKSVRSDIFDRQPSTPMPRIRFLPQRECA